MSYEQDKNWLDIYSKGAALPFNPSSIKPPKNAGAVESSLLLPLLKGSLPKYRLRCIAAKEENVLGSVFSMIAASKLYVGLEKELVLSAVLMLGIATLVSKRDWSAVSEDEKKDLRSDDRALKCIRDWDRHSTGLKILYLKFILHARQLIAHISNNTEESKTVASLQTDLERIIQTEFPLNIMKEVVRENGQFSINFTVSKMVYNGFVDEVQLLSVKGRRNYGNMGSLFLDNFKLYVSVEESYGNNYCGGWGCLLKGIIQLLSKKETVIRENPMLILLK